MRLAKTERVSLLAPSVSDRKVGAMASGLMMGRMAASTNISALARAVSSKKISIEAANVVLNLNKMFANFFPHNPASRRVMEKSGMRQEAVLRQEIYKNGKFLDFVRYSILKENFKK